LYFESGRNVNYRRNEELRSILQRNLIELGNLKRSRIKNECFTNENIGITFSKEYITMYRSL